MEQFSPTPTVSKDTASSDTDDSASLTEKTTESDSNNCTSSSSSLSTQQQHDGELSHPAHSSDSSIRRYLSGSRHQSGSVVGHVLMADDAGSESGYDETASTTSSCMQALQNYADECEETHSALNESMVTRTEAFDLSSSSHSAPSPPSEDQQPRGKLLGSPDAVNAILLPRKSSLLSVKLDPDEYLVRHWSGNDGPIDFNSEYDWGHWNKNGRQSRNDGTYFSENDVPHGEEDWLSYDEDEEACERAAYEMSPDDCNTPQTPRPPYDSPLRDSLPSQGLSRTWSFPPGDERRETAAVLLSPVERVSQLHQRHVGGGSAASSVDGRVLCLSNEADGKLQSFSKSRRFRRIGDKPNGSPSAQLKLPRNTRLGRLFIGAFVFAISSMAMSLWYIIQPKNLDVAIDGPTNFRNEVAEKLRKTKEIPRQNMRLRANFQNKFTILLTPSSSHRSLSKQGRLDLSLNSIDVHSSCPLVQKVHMSWPTENSDNIEGSSDLLRKVGNGKKVEVLKKTIRHRMTNFVSLGKSESESLRTKTSAVLLLADDVVLSCEEMERAFQIWKQNPDRMVGFYGYRHIPGPTASNGTKSDGYSIVSDKAAFVHRDLLAMLSANMGDEKDFGGELAGSPCEDAELSVRITALTSLPPIVVAGRPLELRSGLDAADTLTESTLNSNELDVDDASCLSVLMRELGEDDLPVENRMYIGPGMN